MLSPRQSLGVSLHPTEMRSGTFEIAGDMVSEVMLDKANLIRLLAEGYTAAWGSQNAANVASFYEENGSLSVNDDPACGRTGGYYRVALRIKSTSATSA